MESFVFQHVNYTYPEQTQKALDDLSFSIEKGSFTIFCGPSGCGKSTLLHHLKTCLTPYGTFSGDILFEGAALSQVEERVQAKEIGFVLQSPENQVVTDKVWHELSFGLESLGYATPTIRRKVAEMAAFFGIETWFYKNVNELSGGQKQLLSLASVMVMQPSVLVLDEPTSQLDPIAASEFLSVLGKINRELGTTIILTEHRLEEAFPFATQVIVLDQGRLVCDGTPQEVGIQLKSSGHGMFLAMPTAMRIWAAIDNDLNCPMTVRDGSNFLSALSQKQKIHPLEAEVKYVCSGQTVLRAENLWFRYEKNQPDIVKGMQFTLKKGELYALLGGNGTGKTTALKLLAGLRAPYRGKVEVHGKIGLLPQNPQTLFVKRTVREDLYEIFRGQQLSHEEQAKRVAYVVELCGLKAFLDRHPYDISGGEQQRTALAKVLLTEPDILLLDEPTKGFDAEFKVTFAGILKKLLRKGLGVLMVSHDVAFCAEQAHRCGLFFDGNIVTEGSPRSFFSGNNFYTTPANRMARHILPEAVTVSDVISCCGGTVLKEKEPEVKSAILPPPAENSVSFKPQPLPLWRKAIALICGLIAGGTFVYATSITDLTQLIDAGGLTAQGKEQWKVYAALILSLLGLIAAIGRRAEPPVMQQTPRQQRKLSKRTAIASLLIILFIPLTIFGGVFYLGASHYNILALLVLLECMLPFVLVFEGRKPKPRELVVIAVLCAIGVAGRSAFFMLPQFKPVMALTIIAGVALGGETGFFVGAMTMLASNMLFSHGPWTPWQMFSMGIIGFLAGVLFRKGLLRRNATSLAVFGAIAAIVIYGGIMNPSSAILYSTDSLNWNIVLAQYVSGFPMDLVHAMATFIFLEIAAEPMLEKLDRIKTKYGLVS